jgi:hypothetical protein
MLGVPLQHFSNEIYVVEAIELWRSKNLSKEMIVNYLQFAFHCTIWWGLDVFVIILNKWIFQVRIFFLYTLSHLEAPRMTF